MSERLGVIPDLSKDQYLAAPGVSHSMLKLMRERSPLHLRAYLDTPAPQPTDAERIGDLTHRCLLLPDTMKDAFWIKPVGMKFTTKDGIAWRAEHQDRPIIQADEMKRVENMVAAVHRHPIAKRLLANATYEQSIFVEDKHGTMRKLRPDVLPRGGTMLPDLKTCESAAHDDFEKAVGKFSYFSQGSYYLDGCALAGMDFEIFVLIAVEKEFPHAVATYPIDPIVIDYGRRLNEAQLARYRTCMETGLWPGYDEQLNYVALPPWQMKQAEQAA
jgi:hypothetical protein